MERGGKGDKDGKEEKRVIKMRKRRRGW